MADLVVWFGSVPAPGGTAVVNGLFLDDVVGSRATIADCATSKQTAAAPISASDQAGYVAFALHARGGALWFTVGDNPTAVATAAGNFLLAEDGYITGVMRAGKRIAAINA